MKLLKTGLLVSGIFGGAVAMAASISNSGIVIAQPAEDLSSGSSSVLTRMKQVNPAPSVNTIFVETGSIDVSQPAGFSGACASGKPVIKSFDYMGLAPGKTCQSFATMASQYAPAGSGRKLIIWIDSSEQNPLNATQQVAVADEIVNAMVADATIGGIAIEQGALFKGNADSSSFYNELEKAWVKNKSVLNNRLFFIYEGPWFDAAGNKNQFFWNWAAGWQSATGTPLIVAASLYDFTYGNYGPSSHPEIFPPDFDYGNYLNNTLFPSYSLGHPPYPTLFLLPATGQNTAWAKSLDYGVSAYYGPKDQDIGDTPDANDAKYLKITPCQEAGYQAPNCKEFENSYLLPGAIANDVMSGYVASSLQALHHSLDSKTELWGVALYNERTPYFTMGGFATLPNQISPAVFTALKNGQS